MTSLIDVRSEHLRIVQDILRAHLPIDAKAWVFGSRAVCAARRSSDLDLAIEGKKPLGFNVIHALHNDFKDSNLPYAVDVVDINRISSSFKQIVEAQKTPLPIPKDPASAEIGRHKQLNWKSEQLINRAKFCRRRSSNRYQCITKRFRFASISFAEYCHLSL